VRRVILILIGVSAALAVMVGSASGAVKCGHLYQPVCAAPRIAPISISATCQKTGAILHLPAITITSVAGLKTITVTVAGRAKPLATYNNLHSATRKTIRGLTVNTHGLGPGAHTIVIKATDTRNKTSKRTLRLAICKITPPPFTG
jgi:hypothetical protein